MMWEGNMTASALYEITWGLILVEKFISLHWVAKVWHYYQYMYAIAVISAPFPMLKDFLKTVLLRRSFPDRNSTRKTTQKISWFKQSSIRPQFSFYDRKLIPNDFFVLLQSNHSMTNSFRSWSRKHCDDEEKWVRNHKSLSDFCAVVSDNN